jgi:hypothetical protein
MSDKDKTPDANRDPLSGTPGAHPLGVGAGAAGGGSVGTVIGAAAGGPVGAVIGAAIGAVAGGLGGKGVAEMLDPTVEDAYWRETFAKSRPTGTTEPYELYQPAYRHGWESQRRYNGKSFDAAETDVHREWDVSPHAKTLSWDRARHAVRDAWERVERTVTGHSGNKKM